MSLDKMKARLGAISPGKLDQIYTLSKSAHKLLTEDLPRLIETLDAIRYGIGDLESAQDKAAGTNSK
jgi:hypothetical protein